jgi:hypothetical protein
LTLTVTVDGVVPDEGDTESQFTPEFVEALAVQLKDPLPVLCTWNVWLPGLAPTPVLKLNCVVLTVRMDAAVTTKFNENSGVLDPL